MSEVRRLGRNLDDDDRAQFAWRHLGEGGRAARRLWPALIIVLCGILPTFAWRARAEEKLLSRTFGDRFAVYRQRTKMIIPHLL